MPDSFTFERHGRSTRTLAVVIAVWFVLIALIIVVDAAWWLMALVGLTTLPAVWDLIANPASGLALNETRLTWYSGKRKGTLELAEIDHMRFDTRWDFSVRVTAVLGDGKKVRLPPETLPPHKTFETALTKHGLRVERHHFAVF